MTIREARDEILAWVLALAVLGAVVWVVWRVAT
jgi:hypothetical protein